MSENERRRGVVSWSSGNHGVGTAAAAALLGVQALVVMPKNAPRIKVEMIRGFGAQIHFYDPLRENRETIARSIAAEHDAIVVPSYDDPLVIAGQGTVGLEVLEQAAALGVEIETLLAGAAGGGLLAGCGIVFEKLSPRTRLYSVEPEHYDDVRLSLEKGKRTKHAATDPTLCDCLLTKIPGKLTFPIMQRTLAGGLAVSDDEAAQAVIYAASKLKLIAEPGGAVALAALLAGKVPVTGPTCIVITGGNVDLNMLAPHFECGAC